jgi:diguanylate cyclase (GGDEF)-like protein/PAS domain S-box-containing protein
MTLVGYHDPVLVALSIAVATLASFTALNLAGRLLVAERAARVWWLLAGAVALGGGIWSMHFIGMLAFIMPMPVLYQVDLTVLSLFLSVFVVGAGLYTVSRFGNGPLPLLASGFLAGLGIVAMHYCGMAAMTMPGVVVSYDPLLFAASVAIAVVAATAAFWLAFRTSKTWERLLAAVVMGFAISGMHYTAMAGAEFVMNMHASMPTSPEIQPGILAVAVASATSILLLLGLITAFFDHKLSILTAREALALTQSEERLRALHRNASEIVAILDARGSFVYEASSALPILGYETKELIGRPLTDFLSSEGLANAPKFLERLLAEPGAKSTMEFAVRHADGTWREFEMVGKNLLHDRAINGLVVNMRDISERKRLMAALERLSETDSLTGLLNRRGFKKLASQIFEQTRRNKRPLTLVMMDIDHFKGVNDTFGHAAGDLVLAMVAERCRRNMRKIDVLGRFGGEEFIILLGDASLSVAHDIIARVHSEIAAGRVATIKGEVAVTASFGVATIDTSSVDLETAVRLADEALYEAKNSGRNCIKIRA